MPAAAPALALVKEHISMNQTAVSEMGMLPALQGTPSLDINKNTLMAMRAGRSGLALLTEAVRLMRGAGKLSAPEYFYYRLWEQSLSLENKGAFVGKKAQHLMHLACNDRHWYQVAADKILFQTIMTGAGLPVPETLAVTQPMRWLPRPGAVWCRRTCWVAPKPRDLPALRKACGR